MAIALVELESEGFVLRGRFTAEASTPEAAAQGDATLEWCERRLLARIHRYTIKTLRAEIEPVSAADFMRFLLDWQGVTRHPRPEGVESLAAVIAQLEGYEVPAAAWESDVLAARLNDYDPHWLDSLCLSGRALWARLQPAKSAGRRARCAARRSRWYRAATGRCGIRWPPRRAKSCSCLMARARSRDYLREHGASFFDDMVGGTTLLRSQAETALGELVSRGPGQRGQLQRPARAADSQRQEAPARDAPPAHRPVRPRRRRPLEPDPQGPSFERSGANEAEALEQVADILLRRYGVVFRRLLEREADWLPPWHALLRVFRRLEAQGKIRGGRFVAGMSGEQYALPDAVSAMRAIRRQEARGDFVSLSAADPLNLTGIITPGARVPGADQQSRAVSRRCAGGDAHRGPVGFPGGDGAGQGMGSAPGAVAPAHDAGTARLELSPSRAPIYPQTAAVRVA